MRNAIALTMLLALATPAAAQVPKLGEVEVKAYQQIPKTKTAVQLTQDTALGRHLRGLVMERLARRGNDVGFSGGNVMRMDVTYLDLIGSSGGGSAFNDSSVGGQPGYAQLGSNPRPELPGIKLERRDSLQPKSSPTMRIGLTLYSVDAGKVLWAATVSCLTNGNSAQRVGEIMVEALFAEPDKTHIGDAGCPL
ncbi:MAG TPA: hypothetical protein VMI56_28275 [Reyranella sp.]|nr:hypothetical protein [Reyranella sp.]